jgi:lipopolysaccharide/colanic/teichoic acid biosynthesis glycosyltransferase
MQYTSKRFFDFIFSFLLIIILFPILILIGFLVLVFSGKPIIYKQKRIGFGCRTFTIYKFRSMYPCLEHKLFVCANDPQVTPLGRFLRHYKLDELPQLFNVLKGDMSFVGPRPTSYIVNKKISESITSFTNRYQVLPGITGLGQIKVPEFKCEEWGKEVIGFDMDYIEKCSFWLDVKIVLQTIIFLLKKVKQTAL